MTQATSRRVALFALAVIFTANFFSYLDRQLVSALEKPLTGQVVDALGKPAPGQMDLTEAQFGFLWTLFTIGYMVFAIPIGFMADRFNRPRILAFCIVIWSAATIASGMAHAKPLLYASRFLIGVGEAGCLIIGQSLIADFFAQNVRGKALSVFHLAVPIGGTVAFIMAGQLGKLGVDWRTLFFIAGAPGFLIAILVLLLRDPPRGGDAGGHGSGKGKGIRQYAALFRTPSLVFIILAQAFAVIFLVSLIHFGVKFFGERLSMKDDDAKIAMGLMALVAGGLGTFLSGVIGDRLSRRYRGAYALMAGVSFLAALPLVLAGLHSTDKWIAFPFLTAGSFCIFLCMPAVNTQIANVTHPAQRATAWSLAVFVLHLLGDTTAPILFGKVSETAGRLNAFTWFSASLALAGISCLIAAKYTGRDLDRLQIRIDADTQASKGVV